MTPSNSTLGQDADEIKLGLFQIMEKHGFEGTLIACTDEMLEWLKSRQPHVALTREELAQIIEQGMHGIEWTAGKRPSIAELEAILNSAEAPGISMLPDGSITAGEPRDAAFKCADIILDRLCLTKAEAP